MENKIENGKLVLFLKGELNSYTSEDVEKEIEDIINESTFEGVVIDMKNLNYISSAGIRIIVRLKQRFDDTSLVNVPKGIFDIFEMVGLQNLIKIEKLK